MELDGWRHGFVRAEEVEVKVRLVMQCKARERLRERVTTYKEAVAMAWKDGGSSRMARLASSCQMCAMLDRA